MFSALLSVILIINELMASNAGIVMSPATNFDSWIELYNPSGQAVSLAGMYLIDGYDNRWQMPKDIGSVPAKGYKVVWLGSNEIKSTQAPFKLDCDGGFISLSDAQGNRITSLSYPKAISRTSYARKSIDGEEWGWTADATPGASNATAQFATERLAAPEVSVGSRLFTSSLDIQVTIPEGTKLYYTTDGSLPAPSASGSKQSTNGRFSISRTTAYTFRLFRDGYLPSVPITRSYIKTSNKYTMPIISIVGDKSFFTDPKIGFDCDGDGTNGKIGNGQNSPKNYNQPWDRPANFSYLSPDGEMLFNQDVNIAVSGGWTRSQSRRSFKLKASKVFDGQNRFDYSFFPQKPYIRNKNLLVRNGGNDVWTHNARFMDPALETIIQRSGIDLDVQSYVPIIEYVNGQLRGVLNLREPNNDKFAYANWGYDDEELDAFENLEMKNGNDSVIKRIFTLGQRVATDDEAYEELKTLLDIDEFTNYMAVTMFLDNDDWPNNNIKAYRSQNGGRYRFVSFDLDYAFTLRNFNKNGDNPFAYFLLFKDASTVQGEANRNREIVRLFFNLLAREDFRRRFIDTFCIVGGSVFEPSIAGDIVDELLAKVQPMCQLMRNQGISEGHQPDRAASTIKTKLSGRSKKMAGHLKDFSYAKLSKTAQAVTLMTETKDSPNKEVEGAHLYINDLDVPYAYFNGHLFAPVTLRAEAPVGYRFVNWKKGSTVLSNEEQIALPTGSTVNLTAVFEKLDDSVTQDIPPVRINEVSADDGIYVNEYFKRKDWVELYNTTDKPIDVAGMYLTDNLEKPTKYQITEASSATSSTIIPAHGYLVVWCDGEKPLSQLHASFKISNDGDELQLMAADNSWTDRITYPAHKSDQTVGRYPDGSNKVYVMNVPTIAKANIKSSYAEPVIIDIDPSGVSDLMADQTLSIAYVSGRLVVNAIADNLQLTISRLTGQTALSTTLQSAGGVAELSLAQLREGAYVAVVTDGNGNKAVCKFIKR
jgi:hypothetical protein